MIAFRNLTLRRGPREILREVDATLLAERRNRRAGIGIQRVEIWAGAHEEALVAAVCPVGHAAADTQGTRAVARGRRKRIELPLGHAGRGVEREDLQLRRRGVQHAVDDDRVALNLRPVVGTAIAGAAVTLGGEIKGALNDAATCIKNKTC